LQPDLERTFTETGENQMPNNLLYRILVPDAPLQRRTEGDISDLSPFGGHNKWNNKILENVPVPGLQNPSLISSCKGSISRVLFCFPAMAVEEPGRQAYRSVIAALRPGTRFVIVHHEAIREDVASWFTTAGHKPDDVLFVPMPNYVKLTDWAEDAYVCLTDLQDGATYLVEPWQFLRSGDALIADSVEEYADIKASQVPLVFQGGNCLIGEKFWMLGKDYFSDTVNALANKTLPIQVAADTNLNEKAVSLFKNYIDRDRELLLVGSKNPIAMPAYVATKNSARYILDIPSEGMGTYQPIFHIDMFVSLAGTSMEGKPQVLVGSPAMADKLLKTKSPYALNATYDSIAQSLADEGFSVLRNPIVHRPTVGRSETLEWLRGKAVEFDDADLFTAVKELAKAGAMDSTAVTFRSWHHITWNNCLVEDSATHGKHVYLPTYGHGPNDDLAVIDKEMALLWEGLGFKVHLLGDFNSFAERQGVVHCIKKYLARGD
jgi:hypothetical protein